jgi:hypothetical protein
MFCSALFLLQSKDCCYHTLTLSNLLYSLSLILWCVHLVTITLQFSMRIQRVLFFCALRCTVHGGVAPLTYTPFPRSTIHIGDPPGVSLKNKRAARGKSTDPSSWRSMTFKTLWMTILGSKLLAVNMITFPVVHL